MENLYTDEYVKELNKKDFTINNKNIILNKNITSKLNGILIIYAPWCETCQISKKMWENLASLFKYKFNIYAINTYNYDNNNQDLKYYLDVRSYPCYKFVNKNGKIKNFDIKSESEIVKFIIKNI